MGSFKQGTQSYGPLPPENQQPGVLQGAANALELLNTLAKRVPGVERTAQASEGVTHSIQDFAERWDLFDIPGTSKRATDLLPYILPQAPADVLLMAIPPVRGTRVGGRWASNLLEDAEGFAMARGGAVKYVDLPTAEASKFSKGFGWKEGSEHFVLPEDVLGRMQPFDREAVLPPVPEGHVRLYRGEHALETAPTPAPFKTARAARDIQRDLGVSDRAMRGQQMLNDQALSKYKLSDFLTRPGDRTHVAMQLRAIEKNLSKGKVDRASKRLKLLEGFLSPEDIQRVARDTGLFKQQMRVGTFEQGPFRRLFHGTRKDSDVERIVREGFAKGESSELRIPGTSLSRDPLASLAGPFANRSVERLVVAEVPADVAADIMHMKPSDYITKRVQIEQNPKVSGFSHPNLFYEESETSIRRFFPEEPTGQQSLLGPSQKVKARRLTPSEDKAVRAAQVAEEELATDLIDFSDAVNGTVTPSDIRDIGATFVGKPTPGKLTDLIIRTLRSAPTNRRKNMSKLSQSISDLISNSMLPGDRFHSLPSAQKMSTIGESFRLVTRSRAKIGELSDSAFSLTSRYPYDPNVIGTVIDRDMHGGVLFQVNTPPPNPLSHQPLSHELYVGRWATDYLGYELGDQVPMHVLAQQARETLDKVYRQYNRAVDKYISALEKGKLAGDKGETLVRIMDDMLP